MLMGKGMHSSTYTGNSEIKGGRELSFLSVVGKQGHKSEPSDLAADSSTLCNVPEPQCPHWENGDQNASW